MKKFMFLCLLSVLLFGENAITAANSQRLVFEAQPNAFDDYNSVFIAFDKGASIVQSYEKLARMHAQSPVKRGFADNESAKNETAASGENAKNAAQENDADGCACQGLVPKIEPYKDFHHKENTYLWQGDKKLIIKRSCWGGGHYYFELQALQNGTKITAKFRRD